MIKGDTKSGAANHKQADNSKAVGGDGYGKEKKESK